MLKWVRYGMPIVRIFEKIDHDIMAPHCGMPWYIIASERTSRQCCKYKSSQKSKIKAICVYLHENHDYIWYNIADSTTIIMIKLWSDLHSWTTPHTSPLRTRYEESFVSDTQQNVRDIYGEHTVLTHDVTTWKCFPYHHLKFSLLDSQTSCWKNCWVAGDLRCHDTHVTSL